jgi:hypothetical protein
MLSLIIIVGNVLIYPCILIVILIHISCKHKNCMTLCCKRFKVLTRQKWKWNSGGTSREVDISDIISQQNVRYLGLILMKFTFLPVILIKSFVCDITVILIDCAGIIWTISSIRFRIFNATHIHFIICLQFNSQGQSWRCNFSFS